jgi:hypothetical protein
LRNIDAYNEVGQGSEPVGGEKEREVWCVEMDEQTENVVHDMLKNNNLSNDKAAVTKISQAHMISSQEDQEGATGGIVNSQNTVITGMVV